jgi:hypothetical protein
LVTAPQAEPSQASSGLHDGAAGASAGSRPARALDYVTLDSARDTRLYWAGVALVIAGLFVTRLLPCVDYPQHLALSDVARRLSDPAAPEAAKYQLNYFTYNGLFHVTVAWLSRLLPIELAGRLVVSVSLGAMAAAVVALLRVLRRPVIYAALFTPILFSFSVGWGFVNYTLATAIAAWALVFVARVAVRPAVLDVLAVGVLGVACAFAHVLAMLILCLGAAAIALEASWRATPAGRSPALRLVRVMGRAILAALPLVLGCVYCILVYREQYVWDPNMYRDPTLEGAAPPLWEKLLWFGAYSTDLFWDATDQIVLWCALAIMGWAEWLAWKGRRAVPASPPEPSPTFTLPLLAMAVAYFATPMVLVGTHLIFPRLAQWVVLAAVLAVPRFPVERGIRARAEKWILGVGLVSGCNLVLHCGLYAVETNDASRVIDDLPVGGAATAVIWDPGTYAFRNGTLTHLAAYYAARKHGSWAFAFARYLSVPVRFKPGSQPAWPAQGWEFDADQYDARCKYARAFPLVITKVPAEIAVDDEAAVRKLVFKKDAAEPRLLSHHGHFWAFDTTGLPDDGTL